MPTHWAIATGYFKAKNIQKAQHLSAVTIGGAKDGTQDLCHASPVDTDCLDLYFAMHLLDFIY